MPGARLATFDCEGLVPAASRLAADERLILQALAIGETAADVVALVGVADTPALEALRAACRLAVGRDYRHALLLGGNDPAGHPALLSNLPIVHARSHRTLSFAETGQLPPPGLEPGVAVFGRDCLEAAVEQQGCRLTLFVCHFQGPAAGGSAAVGEDAARARRQAEALAVRQVIEQRFDEPAAAEWVILGNLGDQPAGEAGLPDPNHGLGPLLDDGFAVDLVTLTSGLTGERWTHYDWAADRYLRHDHILLAPALARRNRRAAVRIVRAGLPFRAARHAGARYPRIGWLEPGAGWHCPVVADLDFSGEARADRLPYRAGGGRPGLAL
jgi:hypothetical protein